MPCKTDDNKKATIETYDSTIIKHKSGAGDGS